MAEVASEFKAIDILGLSPPLKPKAALKVSTISLTPTNDAPDEASKDEDAASSSSDKEGQHGRKRKKKVVTFAEFSNEPQGIMDTDDQEDEEENIEHPSPLVTMRYKRSASLPHIELNQKLTKKIKKMLDKEENEEDSLNTLLEGTLKFFEEPDKSPSELYYEYEFQGGQLLQVRIGDITEECVEVIVNEANSNLQHSRGIAGAIAQKGGRDIQHQSDRWIRKYGPVPPGAVAITEAGALHAKRVIHAVGPIWRGGNSNEDHEYWDAIYHALELAHRHKFKSIAIPPLGVGFLGFPVQRFAYLVVDCVSKFFMQNPKSKLREIRLLNLDSEIADALKFEMVGKFTAGCDTSESERSDFSGSEMEDEELEDEDEDTFEDDEPTPLPRAATSQVNQPIFVTGPINILPKDKRNLAWNRRQSIA